MIRFRQLFGAHAGRVIELEQEVVRFGRMPDCEVAFDPHADLDASGRHAEVWRRGSNYVVVDSGSRNGTWVNGARVEEAVLADGDEIEFGLGGPRVRVELVAAASAAPPPAARGVETAQATPIDAALLTPVSGDAPTMMAPSMPPSTSDRDAGAAAASAQATAPGPTPVDMPPTASGPRRYGQRTVGLMIQGALQQQARGMRGMWLALGCLTVLLFGVTLAFVAFVMDARGPADGAPEPGPTAPPEPHDVDGSAISARAAPAIYLLAAVAEEGAEPSRCTAFAVRPRVLATTARCVLELEPGRGAGGRIDVIPNGGGPALRVARLFRHPEFRPDGADSLPDVGLVEVDGDTRAQLELASMDRLVALSPGSPLFVFSFPVGADRAQPEANLATGRLAQIATFDGAPGTPVTAQRLAHDVPGERGAPVFDADGDVVGVHVGDGRAARADVLMSLLSGLEQAGDPPP